VNLEGLPERLRSELHGRKVVILCLGSEIRGDDAAGLQVCDHLAKMGLSDLVIRAGLVPEAFLPELGKREAEVVLIVDAVDAGLPPGSVVLAEPPFQEGLTPISTHGLPLDLLASLFKEELPNVRILLLGIQVAQTEVGSSISRQVAHSVRLVADLINQAL